MIVLVTAYKRPKYLAQCLQSLGVALNGKHIYTRVSLDYHSDAMTREMRQVAKDAHCYINDVDVAHHQKSRLGPANHMRLAVNNAVDDMLESSDYVVHIEEDAIVAPDTFDMIEWATNPRIDILNLGPKGMVWQTPPDPSVLREDYELRTSYGWAFTVECWRTMEPYWNGKIREPYGWDWWVTAQCYRDRFRILTPEVSRVQHIGREEGTYCAPEHFDAAAPEPLCPSKPSHYTVDPGRPKSVPDWVIKELRP